MKLNAQKIARYRPPEGKSDHIEFDDTLSGFGLRIRDGRKSWIFQYAITGGGSRITRRMTFGNFPDLPPTRARSIAAELSAKVRLGQDPAGEKKINRSEAGHTFGRLVSGYLEFKRGQLRDKSYAALERYLGNYAKPLHGLPASAIDLRKVADFLDTIAKERGDVSANRARTCLSAMFSWAMRRGLHDNNPVANTEARKEQSRDRVLTDNELALVWNTVGDTEFGAIIKLLILTAQRAGEIGGLRWGEIDFEEQLIRLPSERTKNARPHEIPMSGAVAGILQTRSRDGDCVFGRGANGFLGWGKSKIRLDAALTTKLGKEFPHFTIHDLRRTAATRMVDLGEGPHVVEAVLNHVSGHRAGVAGIYNRSLYKAEKAQALSKWATHVLAIAKGKKSNVTPLRKGA